LFIDTREPRSTFYWASVLKIPYESKFLSVGDFETEKTVFERKTVGDFIQSLVGQKVSQGYRKQRLFDQLTAMQQYCEDTGRVGFLVISGSLDEVSKWYKERKLKLNDEAIYGALASAVVRYGMNVIWVKDDRQLVDIVWKIAKKVEEGKLGQPHRTTLRHVHKDRRIALIANILRVSPRIAERMFKRFGGLGKIIQILDKHPEKLWIIDGIGEKTIHRMRVLLGFEHE